MYKEKKEFMNYLSELNNMHNLEWDYDYMYQLSSAMSKRLDQTRFLDKDEFIELLEHNYGNPEDYKDIKFGDEIVKIEEVGEEELIDIEVSDDNLFYANGILTHNSAFGNTEVGMESISESIGLAATADTMIAMIATDAMRDLNQVLIKFLKNRNTGMLDSVMLESDYPKMRYTDYQGDDYNEYESQESINTKPAETVGKNDFDFGSIRF